MGTNCCRICSSAEMDLKSKAAQAESAQYAVAGGEVPLDSDHVQLEDGVKPLRTEATAKDEPQPDPHGEHIIVQEGADPDLANMGLENLVLLQKPAWQVEPVHNVLAGFSSKPARMR